MVLVLAGVAAQPWPQATADEAGRHDGASEHEHEHDVEPDHDKVRRAREHGDVRPLEDILPMVRQRFAGEIAQIEIERRRNRWIYEFKVIAPNGQLLEIGVDANTSQVLSVEGE